MADPTSADAEQGTCRSCDARVPLVQTWLPGRVVDVHTRSGPDWYVRTCQGSWMPAAPESEETP